MKYNCIKLLKFTAILTLFCLQLCLIQFEQNMILSPLIITYSYGLFTESSIMTLALLLSLLDAITFMSTGIVGLIVFPMTPISFFLFNIRKNFYNKALAPCLLIAAYQLLIALLLFTFLNLPISVTTFLLATTINSGLLVLFWQLTHQSFHN